MKNEELINFDLRNYCNPDVTYNLSLLLFFKRLSFFSCEVAPFSLNFRLKILLSLASISTSLQLDVCLVSLRCCDRPVIFLHFFHYLCLLDVF